MGKYTKKGKITADVAVMELPSQSGGGVRTRARTLALHQSRPEPESDLSNYLQLRNRRLEKPPLIKPNNIKPTSSKSRPGPGKAAQGYEPGGGQFGHFDVDVDVEASFGENDLDFDAARERSTRESTPCSLIRNPEAIGTPGSATRPTYSNRRVQNVLRGTIPTTPEMEEFFAGFELHQRKLFMEKYNYDIMNDLPLPGRYEWAIQVDN